MSDPGLILVTGATGYVGGRLVPQLLAAGYRVRVLTRDPGRLAARPWASQVEVARGDVAQTETLGMALAGVDTAYYLVHSMQGRADFRQRDLAAARGFGTAARQAGVQRIIYLGGLGDPGANLSPHLRSRQEAGAGLREGGVAVTEFRAAIIVGAGSVSFEMIRHLTERLPVMVCPRWVFTRVQPIGIRDVLAYLIAALQTPESAGKTIEIGGSDVLTYAEMMLEYARARGLRRWVLPVPVLKPNLSAYWVHWVTPISADLAHPLIEGLRNEVVVRDPLAQQIFPWVRPLRYASALDLALQQLDAGQVETAWSDALGASGQASPPVVLTSREGMILERRQRVVQAPPEIVFGMLSGLGGQGGWLYANWAWQLRGVIDRLVGGVGTRRGRRNPSRLQVGDPFDFWRVEAADSPRLLRLRAEMKVPGRAWLQFEVQPAERDNARLVQTAFFAPKGLLGLLYWYALYPIHGVIFSGLCAAIVRRAECARMVSAKEDER